MTTLSSPFVGLTPFDEASQRYFCARDKEVALIIAYASASRLTIFYGPSGAGKSSILGAGLVPDLKLKSRRPKTSAGERPEASADSSGQNRPSGPVPVQWRQWAGDCRETLRGAIGQALHDWRFEGLTFPTAWLPAQGDPEEESPLLRPSGPPIVLVLDQFEELFVQHPEINQASPEDILRLAGEFSKGDVPDERCSSGLWIVAAIVALLNSPVSAVNIVFSLREDCLASLDIFRSIVPNFFSTLSRVERLGEEGLREAITVPLLRWNEDHGTKIVPDPELITALVSDPTLKVREPVQEGRNTARYETPFLQLVLERLWEDEIVRDQGSRLSYYAYDTLGKAAGIRRKFVEGTLQDYLIDDSVRRSVLEASRLLVSKTQKFPWIASELAEAIKGPLTRAGVHPPSGELIAGTLRALAKTRLINELSYPEKDPGLPWDGRFEVAHDALAGDIYRWQVEQTTRLERRQAEESTRLKQEKARSRLLASLAVAIFVTVGLVAFSINLTRTNDRLTLAQKNLETEKSRAEDKAENARIAADRLARSVEIVLRGDDLQKIRTDLLLDPSGNYVSKVLLKALDTVNQAKKTINDAKGGVSPETRERILEEVKGQRAVVSEAINVLKGQTSESRTKERGEAETILGQLTVVERSLASEKNPVVQNLRIGLQELESLGQIPRRAAVCSLDFITRGPHKDRLLVSTVDGVIQIFDSLGHEIQALQTFSLPSKITMATVNADGTLVAVAGEDSNVYQIELPPGKGLLKPYTYHSDVVTCVAFSPDGTKLASTGADGRLRAYGWNSSATSLKSSSFGILTWVAFDHIRDETPPRIVCSADDGFIRVYDFQEHRILWPSSSSKDSPAWLGAPVRRATFSPRDNWVIAASARKAFLLSARDGGSRVEIGSSLLTPQAGGQSPIVWQASFKPRPVLADEPAKSALTSERDLILLCCEDHSARLFGIPEQAGSQPVAVGQFEYQGKPVHGGAIRASAWWRNLEAPPFLVRVALASDDGTASVWEIQGEDANRTAAAKIVFLGIARGHSGPVRNVSFSANGTILATGGDDKTVRLWKTGR